MSGVQARLVSDKKRDQGGQSATHERRKQVGDDSCDRVERRWVSIRKDYCS